MYNNLIIPKVKIVIAMAAIMALASSTTGCAPGDLMQGQVVSPKGAPSSFREATATPAPDTQTITTNTTLQSPINAKDSTITLHAVGDVNPGSRPAAYVKQFGYPYKNIRDLFRSDDLTFGNLECALSSRGKPIPGKEFTFRGAPQEALALKGAGFDIVSVANNHSKDFGSEAFLDTLSHLSEAQLIFSGGGKNSAEAYQPKIVEVKGKKIAFLAFSDVMPGGFAATTSTCGVATIRNREQFLEALKVARGRADLIIVSIHWGKELSTSPFKHQVDFVHKLVGEGVDIVLGHHPHVVQGVEMYRGSLIAYSLGNFMFSPGNASGRQSMILSVGIEDNRPVAARIYPAYIYGIRPELLAGKQGTDWLKEIARRSQGFKAPLTLESTGAVPFLELSVE